MRFLPLVLAVVLVFGGTGVYVGMRVIEPLGMVRAARWLAWCIVLLPAFLPLWFFLDQLEVGRWLDLLIGVTYLALGLISFIFVLAFLRDCVWMGLRTSHSLVAIPGHLPDNMSMLQASSIVVLVVATLLSATAVHNAFSAPAVKSVQIQFDHLHPDLEGFRIVQLSDLHLGAFRGRAFLASIVEAVNRVSPDIVAITGDLTDGSVKKLGETVVPLADLEAPVFFVTGNHEYYWTPDEWLRLLETLDIHVLQSVSHEVLHQEARIQLVGVSDPTSQSFQPDAPSIDAALKSVSASDADLKILLAHRPGTAYLAAGQGFDLQLSGHTHGGQFFPWNLVIHLVQPFAVGLHRFQDMWVYCSRGTGFWGPPMRLGAPSEITEITLRSN